MTLPCLRRRCRRCIVAAVLAVPLFALFSPPLFTQEPSNVVVTVPQEAPARSSLTIAAEVLFGEPVDGVYLLYRTLGGSQYTRVEMDLRGSRATTIIAAADVLPPFLEYYLVIRTHGGTLHTHPLSTTPDPFGQPPANVLRIPVRPVEEPETQALLLSPDPDVAVPAEDLVISLSLFRADSVVDRGATRLLIDGADVSAEAVLSDDILVYVPANFSRDLAPGPHQIVVLLFTADGSPHRSITFGFTVGGTDLPGGQQADDALRYRLSLQLESRRELVSGTGTWYNRGGLQLNGSTGILSIRTNMFLTSDERSDRQPQNRFFFGAAVPWLSAGYGDGYPAFSSLILNGRRVRGLHSSLALGGFTVDLALGQTERPIEGRLLRQIPIDSLAAEQAADPAAAYAPLSTSTWGKFTYGTYERTLFAVRPTIGSGRTWRLGFTWLKAKDDVPSIRFGIRPQENLVIGSDFVARLFDEAVEIFGEGAFSAFNTDISSGNFTDAYIDSVYTSDAADIKRARDILDNFITVNDNLRPLSLKNLATLAYEFGLGLNVLNQNLRATYLYRGSEYHSFGQSFLRKDLRGVSLVDRIRLIDNQVFLSLGYERLKDNTGKTKPATTTFTTIDAAVSYYPLTTFPSVTVGFGRLTTLNGLATQSADSAVALNAVDEVGNRFFVQTSYSFSSEARHTISAGFSVSRRDDRSVRAFDLNDRSATIGITTLFPIPLQTTAEFAYNRSERPAGSPGALRAFTYSTLTFALRYGLIENVLGVRGAASPTYGDFERTLVSAGIDVTLLRSMTLTLDLSRFQQENGVNDSIWNLRYRYDL